MLVSVNINDIMERYAVLFAAYFGSYKTSFYNSESDIDIAVLSKYDLNSQQMYDLMNDLIIYHRKTEIDLINLRNAEPIIKYEVARTGKVLYESEAGIFERYSLFYIKQYYEMKDYINYEMNKYKKEIKEFLKDGR